MSDAQYYLHTNGNIIYKPHGGVDPSSDFVAKAWRLDTISTTPDAFANFLLDCARLGADHDHIRYLINYNHLFDFAPNRRQEFVTAGIFPE